MVLRWGCQRMGFALGGADGASTTPSPMRAEFQPVPRAEGEAAGSVRGGRTVRRPAGSGGARSGPRASRSSSHLEAGAMLLLFGLLHRGRVVQRLPDQFVELRQPVGREPRHLRPPARNLLHRHDLGVPLRGRFPGGHRVRLAGRASCPRPAPASRPRAAGGTRRASRTALGAARARQAVPPRS